MKTIEQLIQLQTNPYYVFTPEERKRLDDFLAEKSGRPLPANSNGDSSEKNIPATVLNKNVVQKETGFIPTINNVAKAQDTDIASEVS